MIIATLLGGVLFILSACASPAPATPPTTPTAPTTPATPATPPTVQVANEAFVNVPSKEFRPSILTVPVGTKVIWSSTDGELGTIVHTVTSTTGLFSGIITNGGATFSYTFTERGTFNYYCEEFPEMKGTVIVR